MPNKARQRNLVQTLSLRIEVPRCIDMRAGVRAQHYARKVAHSALLDS